MKVSEALDAAVAHLWNGRNLKQINVTPYSCNAVKMASFGSVRTVGFMESLGVNPMSGSEFSDFRNSEERQYARALWLTFAAHYARELEAEGEL